MYISIDILYSIYLYIYSIVYIVHRHTTWYILGIKTYPFHPSVVPKDVGDVHSEPKV